MKTEDRHEGPCGANRRQVLLTGSTGNIGAAVTARLLRQDPTAKLILLVRAESAEIGWRRVRDVVEFLSPGFDLETCRGRVTILTGDITEPCLGLDKRAWDQLASHVTEIIHSAATTKFLLPLSCARKINVEGTANVLRLALAARRRGRLRQYVHISTAFVCGDRGGIIGENDPHQSVRFANNYERTKWEGEQLVRRYTHELPIAVVRPSIVVGDSRTGRTTAFNVLYTPLKMIYEGRLNLIPGLAAVQLDVVPLDFVADAIACIALHHGRTVGRTFHLTAGAGRTLSAGEIVATAQEIYEQYSPQENTTKARFIAPSLYRIARHIAPGHVRRMWQLAEPYLPYLDVRRQFVGDNAAAVLGPAGIHPPALRDSLPIILNFAVATNWGRRFQGTALAA